MKGLFLPPVRNLTITVLYMIVVFIVATAGYLYAGWNFEDALYMVVLTIYTVGYQEVRPITTPELRDFTMIVIVLGCTGMIFLTSSLVQFITINQLQQVFGTRRMQSQIDKLKDHVIVCGFGRIGQMLALELKAGGAHFVILERSDKRADEARNLGYLTMQGDATDEAALKLAGIDRARALATVLPDDAANVFITLSARNLNRSLEIIARGEVPSTEKKLRHAGADKVVLPTHIGAERIAEMILYPGSDSLVRGSDKARDVDRALATLGLQMEVMVASENSPLVGRSIDDIEKQANGAFLVVQLKHKSGEMREAPTGDQLVEAGDGLVCVFREGHTGFTAAG